MLAMLLTQEWVLSSHFTQRPPPDHSNLLTVFDRLPFHKPEPCAPDNSQSFRNCFIFLPRSTSQHKLIMEVYGEFLVLNWLGF